MPTMAEGDCLGNLFRRSSIIIGLESKLIRGLSHRVNVSFVTGLFSLASTCKTYRKNSRVLTGFFVAVCESLFKNLQCMVVYDSETKATARFASLPRVGA